MSRQNKLLQSPPYPVEQTMQRLGENLRVARLRRNMTIAGAAERIGTGPRAVMDAEKGKASTGIVIYAALLWLYDQLYQLDEVGDPAMDKDGLTLEMSKRPKRARKRKRPLDNDF
jgi:transcriptional regulator with XRE-family HTH domain